MADLGVPVEKVIRPGRTDGEIDEALASVGLRVPDEARVWWRWMDGQNTQDRPHGALCPGEDFLGVKEAVAHYRFSRGIAADSAEPGLEGRETADELWSPSWFPITVGPASIVVDCSVEAGEPTPIRKPSFEAQTEEIWSVEARSFGEMVTWWCLAMENGVLRWHPDRGLWGEYWAGPRSEIPGYKLM